jgi:hypothetical protein
MAQTIIELVGETQPDQNQLSGKILLTKGNIEERFVPGYFPQHVWPLRVTALSGIPGIPSELFVYRSAPKNDPYIGDSYSCMASVPQLTELPANTPQLSGDKMVPFYRKNSMEFYCRSEQEAEELWEAIKADTETLVANFKSLERIKTTEGVLIS